MSSSQMLKGILDGCLLGIIGKGETYGYEMIEKLEIYGFRMVSEGSIYPVLMRLQKEGFVQSVMKESPSGPKRKYYTLTDAGKEEYQQFKDRWEALSHSVDRLVKEEG
ncbi:PadR family transcriptional regulator [Planococcus salinus]|uniref:PadR family transcriptional regulator n=1 Tax=Planococcus salinus TaxID=1848460 RepID=A0A3M8P8P0_9BACL|nr:PadR family transcriptional regulator [Planococcus salinus]RNF40076.1 PadR family transcriptional regulator [Planococcus salinus]